MWLGEAAPPTTQCLQILYALLQQALGLTSCWVFYQGCLALNLPGSLPFEEQWVLNWAGQHGGCVKDLEHSVRHFTELPDLYPCTRKELGTAATSYRFGWTLGLGV